MADSMQAPTEVRPPRSPRKRKLSASTVGEEVNIRTGELPEDYHCSCKYCQQWIGELIKPDGSYYSRLERRRYYDPIESGKSKESHIAKTPLHVARWAVQQFTSMGDFVLDPTMGSGTTAVEAITQGRSAAGVELQYDHVIRANVKRALDLASQRGLSASVRIAHGDARQIGGYLESLGWTFDLIVNNPPYSGDESMPSPAREGRGKEFRKLETHFRYDRELPNIAFLREGEEYWEALLEIYRSSVYFLRPGGHFVTGVKDMVRERKIFPLHAMICDRVLDGVPCLKFVGTAVLRHYPPTLFISSGRKVHGYDFDPPKYQTISVFQKEA